MPRCALGGESRAIGRGMRVLAVGDQAANDARVGSAAPTRPGAREDKLAHRVKEMGDGARAGVEDGVRLLRARVGMAEADDDPGFARRAMRSSGTETGARVTTMRRPARR